MKKIDNAIVDMESKNAKKWYRLLQCTQLMNRRKMNRHQYVLFYELKKNEWQYDRIGYTTYLDVSGQLQNSKFLLSLLYNCINCINE